VVAHPALRRSHHPRRFPWRYRPQQPRCRPAHGEAHRHRQQRCEQQRRVLDCILLRCPMRNDYTRHDTERSTGNLHPTRDNACKCERYRNSYVGRRQNKSKAKFGGPTIPNSGNASCLVFCDRQTTRLPSQAARSEHWIILPDSTMSRLVRTTVEDRQSRPSTADVQQLSNARTRISIRSR
jgi:hypothetical protein